jgi:hypothetical protein
MAKNQLSLIQLVKSTSPLKGKKTIDFAWLDGLKGIIFTLSSRVFYLLLSMFLAE